MKWKNDSWLSRKSCEILKFLCMERLGPLRMQVSQTCSMSLFFILLPTSEYLRVDVTAAIWTFGLGCHIVPCSYSVWNDKAMWMPSFCHFYDCFNHRTQNWNFSNPNSEKVDWNRGDWTPAIFTVYSFDSRDYSDINSIFSLGIYIPPIVISKIKEKKEDSSNIHSVTAAVSAVYVLDGLT